MSRRATCWWRDGRAIGADSDGRLQIWDAARHGLFNVSLLEGPASDAAITLPVPRRATAASCISRGISSIRSLFW